MLLLQSKSEVALVDDPAMQPIDVAMERGDKKQEVDAVLSEQLNSFIRQAVDQINHPEKMIVSINQRVPIDERLECSIICFIRSPNMSRCCRVTRRKQREKRSFCRLF